MGSACVITAVADTGPLIHLAEIDSLQLLGAVDELLLPATVYDELEAGGVPPALDGLVFDVVEADEGSEWFTTGLDAGEASALDVASKRNAVLLTDDLAAREAAQDADVRVHGSIGVITLAFSRGVVSRGKRVR